MGQRDPRTEHGGIIVLSALLFPVFLLLVALVIDSGNWFAHKRQLQIRADAAALAAGVSYAQNWASCVQSADPVLKAATANAIANVARQYAADPEASDYLPGSLPSSLYNPELANQGRLDVVVNSRWYTDDTDYSDWDTGAPGGSELPSGGTPPEPLADPCYLHPPGDEVSPAGGQWVDVKVKERDLPSLFGLFGLPLSRNTARARVEIRPATAASNFLPVGVPDTMVVKAQLRYFDECNDPSHTSPIATIDLAPFPDADQAAYQNAGGGTLWGPQSVADPAVGDRSHSVFLPIPSSGGCAQPYLPIGVQVRLTSSDQVDINQSCATLASSKFADCFSRLSQIRVWTDGDPEMKPRVKDVVLTGGCPFDSYFARLPDEATNCPYGATVNVEWGTRDDSVLAVAANFSVKVNGVALTPPAPNQPSGTWTTVGTPFTADPGPNDVSVEIDWTDTTTNPQHTWGALQCRNGGQNPCKYDGPDENAHRAFVGNRTNAGAVELVRTSGSTFVMGLPGAPLDNIADGGTMTSILPTLGIRAVLKVGQLTTLRLDDPQANQTLRCDPDYAQGQEFKAFESGCKPWYKKNTFGQDPVDDPLQFWWNVYWDAPNKSCPARDTFFSYGTNSATNAWECVPTAPGLSPPVVGEGMSVATKNCATILNNSCGQTVCRNRGNYAEWLANGGDSFDPRVVRVFVLPYQALKGSTGGDPEEVAPIAGFAAFYVMSWQGSNAQNSDPCPDPSVATPPKGAVVGRFVQPVDYQVGPVDSTKVCVVGQLEVCRAVLVR